MADKVSIINQALVRLGQSPVLSENDDRARDAKQRYDDVVAVLLEMKPPWNFATRRATLTATTTAPVWGYANAFPLPSDFKSVIRLEDATDPYRIEHDEASGTVLLSDLSSVNLLYLADIIDPANWPALFSETVAAKLTWELAPKISRDPKRIEQALRDFREALDEARYADATQAPIEQVTGFGWLTARAGFDGTFRPIEDVTP